MCLFDDQVFSTPTAALDHMSSVHKFDIPKLKVKHSLDCYDMIKLFNYIRRQTSLCICYSCGVEEKSLKDLTAHFDSTGHCTAVQDKASAPWADAMFLMPTYDNDPLLTDDRLMDEDGDEAISETTLAMSASGIS